jgi:parallel beta-helix repeat protein
MKTKRKKTKVVVSVLILSALVVFSLSGYAGKLEPGAPPGPTMKTLDEVEPRTPVQSLPGDANSLYVISQPGSYYLTGKIVGEPNKCGIKIAANNVTLDLMGFSIIGVPGSLDGLIMQYAQTDEPLPMEEVTFNFSIRNGTICNWGGDGIDAYDMFRMIEDDIVEGKILVHSNSELLNVSVHGNVKTGFRGRQCYTHMEDVSFAYNGGNGIEAFDAYLKIEGGNISNNDANGMCVGGDSYSHMEDVSFTYNGGHGMYIFGMMTNVDAYDSCASGNGGNGMYVNATGESYVHMEQVSFNGNDGNGVEILGMMTNVDAYSTTSGHNGGNGMYVNVLGEGYVHMEEVSFTKNDGSGVEILGMMTNVDAYGSCVSGNGGNGMYVNVMGDGYVHMEEVSFAHNDGNGVEILGMMTNVDAYSGYSNHNGGSGIIVGGSGDFNQWRAIGNGGSGIEAGTGSTVRNCTARGNTGDGIVVSNKCCVVGNTCESNGLGAIGTTNPAGIRATGGANRIESNHVIGNSVGIDIDAAGNLIIKNSASGNITTNYELAADNIAGPTVGSSDIVISSNPHANYEY